MSLVTINSRRYLNKFVRRLEKKGFITKPVKGANYRKVRFLTSNNKQTCRVFFITKGDLEIYVDIDVFSCVLDPATYLNNTFHDVKRAIDAYQAEVKEQANAKHSDTGSSDSADGCGASGEIRSEPTPN